MSKSENQKILYLDPFSGIAGDMLVGALLDLGLNLEFLETELKKLKLDGYTLFSAPVLRGAIASTKFDVLINGQTEAQHDHTHCGCDHDHAHSHGHEHHHDHSHAHDHEHHHDHDHDHSHDHGHHHHDHEHTHDHAHDHAHHHHDHGHHHHAHDHRHFGDIKKMIEASGLSARVKAQSVRAFELLAEAEGRMHGQAPEKVAFHEVGAVDSIVDFVGACIGLEALGITEIRSGPVALGGEGGGYVDCAHGKLPVPAFATLELMKDLPVRPCAVNKELTTPTGAALLKALVADFGPLPPMRIEKIGYGAGTRNDPNIPVPNVLRAVLGTLDAKASGDDAEADTVVEIQANVDDAAPEVLGYLSEKLLAAGALDVFFTPVQMKKSRPGTLVTVLADAVHFDALAEALFRETPTFGLRYEHKQRCKLARETVKVQTPWGPVRVKLGRWRGAFMSAHPEYEDCKALAEQSNVPLRQVIDAARAASPKA